MKARLIIAAILLLALFSLKMGTGLLLHDLFHTTAQAGAEERSTTAGNDLDYACHCIDDFLTPFTEATTCYTGSPVLSTHVVNDHVPGQPATLFFTVYLLRGPPVINC